MCTGMYPERSLAVFPQNIVCARNFCNILQPNAPPQSKVELMLCVTGSQPTNAIEPTFCNVGPILPAIWVHRALLLKF